MKIAKNRMVEIDFCLKNEKGETLEKSHPGEPMSYLHGRGTLVPGLEKYLNGQRAGHSFQLKLAPKEAFGVRDESRIFEITKAELGAELTPQVGLALEMQNPDGSILPVRITKVKMNSVVLDANHPLAGQTLHFEGKIISVRKAKKNELSECCSGCDSCES